MHNIYSGPTGSESYPSASAGTGSESYPSASAGTESESSPSDKDRVGLFVAYADPRTVQSVALVTEAAFQYLQGNADKGLQNIVRIIHGVVNAVGAFLNSPIVRPLTNMIGLADFDLRIPVASLLIRLVEPRSPQFRSFMDEVASYYTTTGVLVGKHVFREFGRAVVYSVLVPYTNNLREIIEVLNAARDNITELEGCNGNKIQYYVGYAGTLPARLCRLSGGDGFELVEIQKYLEEFTRQIFGPSAVAIPSIVPTIDAFKQFIEQALKSDKITRTGLSNLSSALAGMMNKICRILLGANRNCGNTGTRQENQEGRDMLIIGAGTMMQSLMQVLMQYTNGETIIGQFGKIIIVDIDKYRADLLAALIGSKIGDPNIEIRACTYRELGGQNFTTQQGGKLYILTALGGRLQEPHLAHIIELIRNYKRVKFIMDDYPPHMLRALVRMIANPRSIPLFNQNNFLDRIRVWLQLLYAEKISVLPRAKVDGIGSNLAGNLTLYPGCPKIKVYLSEIINKVINKLIHIHEAREEVPTWACMYGVGRSMS